MSFPKRNSKLSFEKLKQKIYNKSNYQQYSQKSRSVAAVLCFFFGYLGIHRFYAGKIGTGILWLLTFGLFGFGDIIDFFMIIFGAFKDKDGYYIK